MAEQLRRRNLVMATYWFPPCVAWPSAGARVAGFARWLPECGWKPFVLVPMLPEGMCFTPGCLHHEAPPHEHLPGGGEVLRMPVRPRLSYRAWRSLRDHEDRWPHHSVRRSMAAAARGVTAAWRRIRGIDTTVVDDLTEGALALAARHPLSAVWTRSQPYPMAAIGRRLQRRLDIPWLADLPDPVSRPAPPASPVDSLRAARRPIDWMRLRRADAIVGATPPLARADQRWLRRPVHAIPSGFDPDGWTAERSAPQRDESLTVVCSGALYPRFVEPDALLEAIRLALEDAAVVASLRLHYYGHHGAMLLERARALGVDQLVTDHGFVPAETLRQRLASADVLALITHGTDRAGIPGAKLYDYLAAQRPILAMPGDPYVAELLASTGAGSTASSPPQGASALRRFVRQWREEGEVEYGGVPAVVERFSARRRAQDLAGLLDELVR